MIAGTHPATGFAPNEILWLDLSVQNTALQESNLQTLDAYNQRLQAALRAAGKKAAAGGYNEHRWIYQKHPERFGTGDEARCIHLGVDVWAHAGTPLFAPLDGTIHSLKNNEGAGNYGPTLMLQHTVAGKPIHALFGHLSMATLDLWKPGATVSAGEIIGFLGAPEENGGWPPHAHIQLIKELRGLADDYPGVCTLAAREAELANCPDPRSYIGL